MGCGASSNKTEGGSAATSPVATTSTTTGGESKTTPAATSNPAHPADNSKPLPAATATSSLPSGDKSKDTLSNSSEVREAVATRLQLDHKNAVGQAIDVTKQLLTSGGEVADQATASLQTHKAGFAYQGRTGLDDLSTAQAVFDSLSVLSGSSDLKKAAAAGWVVVSESSKFFTIGKVAIAIIEQIYNLWNAWDKKLLWVGTFIAFLKVVEEELVAGMNTFEHVGFLRALEAQLEQSRDLVRVIQCRSTPMSFLMSTSDEVALNQQKDLIVARKQECLFGHAVEIKATTTENLALLQEIQQLLAQRQKQIDEYKLHPEGPEAFAREQKRIREEFAVIDPIQRIESLQNRWILFQRSKRFQRMNAVEEFTKYVDDYWKEFLLTDRTTMPATKADYFQANQSNFGENEKAAEAQRFMTLSPLDQTKQLQQLKDDADRLLNDIEAAASSASSIQSQQPTSSSTPSPVALMRSLESAVEKGAQCIIVKQSLDRLHSLVSNAQTPSTDSSSQSTDWPSYLDAYSSSLFASLQKIQSAQLNLGFLLSPVDLKSDSTERLRSRLSSFQRISRAEKAFYVTLFQSYYRLELEQLEWSLDLSSDAAKRKEGQPTKGKILAIRAPPPTATGNTATVATSTSSAPYACSSPLSSDESCSIFLAFLVELYPSAFRATHFAADSNQLKQAFEARSQDSQSANNQSASDAQAIPSDSSPASSSDAIARNDLHRAFPSLALQLFAALPIYEANVMAKGAVISREQFNQQNTSDFIVELFGNYMEHEGRLQTPPAAFVEPAAFDSRPSDPNAPLLEKQRKVCVSIDAGQFLSSSPPQSADGIKSGYDWEDSLLDAFSKHVRNIPDWMCFVVTIPYKSKFDRKVLYTGQPGCSIALNLSKQACSNES